MSVTPSLMAAPRMGMGGGVGFVGRVFGGVAARNGAMLTGESISSVAARPAEAAGTIAGDIADRSLGNYMPQLAGHTLKGTQISGGHISTTATGTDGKVSSVEMFNTAQFEKPAAPHSVVTATDGSTWYQMASGEGRNAFYDAPGFTGSPAESEQVAAAFPALLKVQSFATRATASWKLAARAETACGTTARITTCPTHRTLSCRRQTA